MLSSLVRSLGVKPKCPNAPRVSTQTEFKLKRQHTKQIPKVKIVENKGDGIGNDFFKVSSTTKCYKCQSYGYVVANCLDPIKITFINGVPEAESESDLDEFTYQTKKKTKRSYVMTLISTALGQHHRLTYSLLGPPCLIQKKKTTGDELLCSRHSRRLEIGTAR